MVPNTGISLWRIKQQMISLILLSYVPKGIGGSSLSNLLIANITSISIFQKLRVITCISNESIPLVPYPNWRFGEHQRALLLPLKALFDWRVAIERINIRNSINCIHSDSIA